ncbi:MAG: DUF2007 domain-containing protein [Deltaproteobacteria bacterium]|nr:DUF2007 domain-containing protein [Deltaproteobacteria bacterium]
MATDEPSTIAFTGDRPTAEIVKLMLEARGITAEMIGEHPVEGGTLATAIIVPSEQLEDARALVADFESGAAARKS